MDLKLCFIASWRGLTGTKLFYQYITYFNVPPDHLLLDSAPNVGPLISRWDLNKFKNS